MDHPLTGQPAPEFTLPATGGRQFTLAQQRGHPVVLFFYPRDHTPGCTTEAGDFRDLADAFADTGCVIAGISRDSLASHERFRSRQNLPFDLLADTSGTVCRQYNVLREKPMFGRTVEGIERSSFLIDASGHLRQEWRGVKVTGHAEAVLVALQSL